jgi:hypothetical protein
MKLKTQCQFCGQIQKEDGSWNGIKRELIRTKEYSHGTCPECFDIKMKEIKNL